MTTVRGERQINGPQLVRRDLASLVVGRKTGSLQGLLGLPVGPLTDMPVAGACTGNPYGVGQSGFRERAPQHLLADRGPADVPGADHADVQRPGATLGCTDGCVHPAIVTRNVRLGCPLPRIGELA